MKMGQSAFDTAAPRLSKGIERQLTSFVSANLQDTLRESRQYLTTVIDEEALGTVAEDIWESTAETPLRDIAALMPPDTLAELVEIGQDAVAHLVTTRTFRGMLRAVLDANASRPAGELLEEAGVTPDVLLAQMRPWILRAADDGLLEELIRQRLTAFYASY
jgi:hypothetical protein